MKAKVLSANDGTKQSILGSYQWIKVEGADTENRMTLIYLDNGPGAGVPTHTHTREDETFIVLEGELTMTVGDKQHVVGPGGIVFGPRNVPHSFLTTGAGRTRFYVVITPSGMEHMFAELEQLPAGPPDMGKVLEICNRHGIQFA